MNKRYMYAIATVMIWSTSAAVVKLLLSDIPKLEALAVSGFFAFLFLLCMNIKNGKLRHMKQYSVKEYAVMCVLGFTGLFAYTALYYYGLSQLRAQDACIFNYLWPMMIVIFSCVILKEKMTVMKGTAIVCSFVGIIVLSLGNSHVVSGNGLLGAISCTIAAACYGLFSVLNKKINYNQNIAMMVIWLTVSVSSVVLGLMTETWVWIRGSQWIGLVWVGVFLDAVAYLLWALALDGTENTAKIANLAYLTPFLSLVVSAILLKEQIEMRAFAALILIVGGILLQNFCDQKEHK